MPFGMPPVVGVPQERSRPREPHAPMYGREELDDGAVVMSLLTGEVGEVVSQRYTGDAERQREYLVKFPSESISTLEKYLMPVLAEWSLAR